MQYNVNFKDLFVNNMVTVVLINFRYFSFHQYHSQWKWSHWIEPNVTKVEFVFSLRVKKCNDWSVMMLSLQKSLKKSLQLSLQKSLQESLQKSLQKSLHKSF